MSKIVFICAGSTIFAKNLLGDILSFPELAASTISLHDIDPERLYTFEIVAHRIAEALEVNPTIMASTDRRAVLDGADNAIGMFQVGGHLAWWTRTGSSPRELAPFPHAWQPQCKPTSVSNR